MKVIRIDIDDSTDPLITHEAWVETEGSLIGFRIPTQQVFLYILVEKGHLIIHNRTTGTDYIVADLRPITQEG